MKSGIMHLLREDKELKELREEWKKNKRDPFPLFNFDQYMWVEDYKEHIKNELNKE